MDNKALRDAIAAEATVHGTARSMCERCMVCTPAFTALVRRMMEADE